MSAEMLEIDASIQRVFQARDEKRAREAAQRRAEGGTEDIEAGEVKRSSSRTHSSVQGRRLEKPQTRTRTTRAAEGRSYLENVPEKDEYTPKSRIQTESASRKPIRKDIQKTGRRQYSGDDFDVDGLKTDRKPRHLSPKDTTDDGVKKAGVVASGLAGVGAAFLVLLGSIIPSAPAAPPNASNAKNTDTSLKPIHYDVNQNEDGDIAIFSSSASKPIEYDGEENIIYVDKAEAGEASDIADIVAEPVEEAPHVPIEHVSSNFIDAMKGFEGLYLEAYICPGGSLTIGYGHTADVYEGQTITLDEAEELLRNDIASYEKKVREYAAAAGVQLTQGQFDALVDFAYNLGKGAFEDSGLVEMIGDGDLDGAAAHMQKYVYAKNKDGEKVKLPGLVTRRATEAEWLYA